MHHYQVPILTLVAVFLFALLQGYLVVNHLTREDLEDVVLYCKYHCLLAMSAEQRVGQLVIWREVCAWLYLNGLFFRTSHVLFSKIRILRHGR